MEEQELAGPPAYSGPAGALVNKIRQTCLEFTGSPVLNDEFLQVAEEISPSSKIKLVLDVSTRWNSTLRMVRNFVYHEQVLRRFAERSTVKFPLTDVELEAVHVMIRTLAHVEECVKRLCKADTTMSDADLALEVCVFM